MDYDAIHYDAIQEIIYSVMLSILISISLNAGWLGAGKKMMVKYLFDRWVPQKNNDLTDFYGCRKK